VLGPKESYLTLVEQAYKPPTKHDKSPLRPSNAGVCERALFIAYQEYLQNIPIKPLTHREHRIFSLGHAIEAEIIQLFAAIDADFKVMYKQQIVDHSTPTGLIEGSMDWCLISEKHKVIMDAKSRKDRIFGGQSSWEKDIAELSQFGIILDKNGVYLEDPIAFVKGSKDSSLVKNIVQLNVYATSDFCLKRGINHASIIRYNKNDSRWLEVRFAPSIILLNYVIEKFDRVRKATNIDELEGECVQGTMEQRFCPAC